MKDTKKKKVGLKEWPLDKEHRHPKWVRPYRPRWTQGEPRCHKSTRLSTQGCHCWGSPIPQKRAANQRRCESCSAPATKSGEAKRVEHRWPETATSEHPTRTQDPKRRAVLTVVCAWMESSETWVMGPSSDRFGKRAGNPNVGVEKLGIGNWREKRDLDFLLLGVRL